MVKKNVSTNVQKKEVVFVEDLRKKERNENDKYYYVSRCKDNYKVVYEISVTNKELFDNTRYEHIYNMLDNNEQKLQKKLPYTVNLNFIVLEHLRKYFEEVGMKSFEEELGTLMFAFINDLCEQSLSTQYNDVRRDFLNYTRIEEFAKFYSSNKRLIKKCRERKCNPIYMFAACNGIAYTNYGIDDLLKALKSKNYSKLQKDFVIEILTNFFNDLSRSLSDRSHTEVSYEVKRINDCLDEFTDEVLEDPYEKAKIYEKIFNQ